MQNYKISIIVPVYNAEQYLNKCVESLRNQTYQNLEILLVNDGSKDASGKLCDAYAKEDARIKAVHKENGGLISAWKKGVAESTGEYLSFVDSDDWVDLVMIEEMAEHLTGDKKEIVASDYVIERDNGSSEYVWQQLPSGEYLREDIEKKVIPNLLGKESRYVAMSRCMKLISRGLIEENQKYCNPAVLVGEDTTIMLPSLIDCNRIFVMDHKAYYHYLYVQESMVHKYNVSLEQNIELLIETTKKIITDKFSSMELQERLYQVNQESVFWYFLVLKNEARGNPKGYRKNIPKVCREEKIRSLIKNTKVEISETSNKLLYLVMKHPNHLTVSILRAAMIWYYRKVK